MCMHTHTHTQLYTQLYTQHTPVWEMTVSTMLGVFFIEYCQLLKDMDTETSSEGRERWSHIKALQSLFLWANVHDKNGSEGKGRWSPIKALQLLFNFMLVSYEAWRTTSIISASNHCVHWLLFRHTLWPVPECAETCTIPHCLAPEGRKH